MEAVVVEVYVLYEMRLSVHHVGRRATREVGVHVRAPGGVEPVQCRREVSPAFGLVHDLRHANSLLLAGGGCRHEPCAMGERRRCTYVISPDHLTRQADRCLGRSGVVQRLAARKVPQWSSLRGLASAVSARTDVPVKEEHARRPSPFTMPVVRPELVAVVFAVCITDAAVEVPRVPAM